MYSSITATELKKYVGKINIIDVRDSYLYRLGSIPTAKSIPINYLLMNPDNYLNKKDIYYLFCDYGMKSSKACNALANKGYQVINVLGGYNEYISK